MNIRKNNGITLITLVITIVVLIILAGISINLVLGENGLFTKAKDAAKNMEIASLKEKISTELLTLQTENIENNFALEKGDVERILRKYGTVIKSEDGNITGLQPTGKDYEIPFEEIWQGEMTNSYNEKKHVNAPKIAGTGLTPVIISNDGTITKTNENDTNWYNYEEKNWANAQSADGSLWVWIPRYAYKIQYDVDSDHSKGGTIDVKFLIGTTDNYEETTTEVGTSKTLTQPEETSSNVEKKAQRATLANVGEEAIPVDTTTDYYVHPAFTDESSIGYANGGWDKELTGIWVAKFEAGYTGEVSKEPSKQTDKVKESNIKYTTIDGWNGSLTKDYYYGSKTQDTKMTYPIFQANRASYNFISLGDSFNLCRALTQSGNPYNLSNKVDSHLMKNSEWGAVVYLAYSKYGQEKKEIRINNISASYSKIVCAVTGYGAATDSEKENTTIELSELLDGEAEGNWHSSQGQLASTTGNITGIYDMNGGTWEQISAFISNGNKNLVDYSKSLLEETNITIANTGHSTKYVTIYPYDQNYDKGSASNDETAGPKNFIKNTKIFGDAVRETTGSKAGTLETGRENSSWNGDFSLFPNGKNAVWYRGGRWDVESKGGGFAFYNIYGFSGVDYSFRAVLVP